MCAVPLCESVPAEEAGNPWLCRILSNSTEAGVVGDFAGIINIGNGCFDDELPLPLLPLLLPLPVVICFPIVFDKESNVTAVVATGVVDGLVDDEVKDSHVKDKFEMCSTNDTEINTPRRIPPTNSMIEFMLLE